MSEQPLSESVLNAVEGPSHGVMLFGSAARGDHSEFSDIDVLQLSPNYLKPYSRGRLNFSVYRSTDLARMAKEGSLFILHLITEGIIISDSTGVLDSTLSEFVQPDSYDYFRSRLRVASKFLDVDRDQYQTNFGRLNGLCMFILRSALFSRFADEKRPCFSLKVASDRLKDSRISSFSKIKYLTRPHFSLFDLGRDLIIDTLESEIQNEFKSAEKLIIENMGKCKLVVSLGLKLIGDASGEIGYR